MSGCVMQRSQGAARTLTALTAAAAISFMEHVLHRRDRPRGSGLEVGTQVCVVVCVSLSLCLFCECVCVCAA